MAAGETNEPASIDPETLSRVAREVIARLGRTSGGPTSEESKPITGSKTNRTAASIDDRVITAVSISRLPAGTAELFVAAKAVLTPSARDEARTRGIAINYGARLAAKEARAHATSQIIDLADPTRASAVAQQLSRRAVNACGVKIILSETPAKELYQQCTQHGEVAVMVGSMDEVQRFASEIDATTWVLDMKRLNLTAAVNVAAYISRIGKSHR